MKTFTQFLIESKIGNYVAVDAILPENLKKELDELHTSVQRIPDNDLHATLIYSIGTTMDDDRIGNLLHHQPEQFHGTIRHVTKFDALPKDGKRPSGLCTIVLEIDCPELNRLHNTLRAIGLNHSYDEYKPHVSLYYDIPIEEAETLIDKIDHISKNRSVVFAGYRIEQLK